MKPGSPESGAVDGGVKLRVGDSGICRGDGDSPMTKLLEALLETIS